VPLRRFDRWQAETAREDLADLYVESTVTTPGHEYRNREGFLGRLADDVRRPGFVMVIAGRENMVGCAAGFPVGRDGFWWHGFDGALPQGIEQLTVSGHLFAVSDVLVHPHEQDPGLGRRIVTELLAGQDASLGVTKVDQADRLSRAAFRSWGWQEIGQVRAMPGTPASRALSIPLGDRSPDLRSGLAHNARTQSPEGSAEGM
jgi:GNAT superfamily N-acetyltransferase